ncbi:MAG: metal-dependent transcriptional regulator [Candidatus Natronoplasma sp.]
MSEGELTKRDREHMITIFLLGGLNDPIGPSKLAANRDMSRAGALQKMKRLEEYGVGEYMPKKGLKINSRGKEIIDNEILRHHVVENFFQESLGMDFEEACKESSKLSFEMSERMIELIYSSYGDKISCDCGLCLDPPFKPEDLRGCHWCKQLFKEEKNDR